MSVPASRSTFATFAALCSLNNKRKKKSKNFIHRYDFSMDQKQNIKLKYEFLHVYKCMCIKGQGVFSKYI